MKKYILSESLAALIIILFGATAIDKLTDLNAFKNAMLAQPFPGWMAITLAYTLPPVELLVAILLIPAKTRMIGLYASFVLMTAFSLYIATILVLRYQDLACGCGKIFKFLTWPQHLLVNLLYVLIVWLAIALKKNRFPFAKSSRRQRINIA